MSSILGYRNQGILWELAEKDQTIYEQQLVSNLYRQANQRQKDAYDKLRINFLTRRDFEVSRVALKKADVPMSSFSNCIPCDYEYSLGHCPSAPTPRPAKKAEVKKETAMYYREESEFTANTDLNLARSYLVDRLQQISNEKTSELRKTFRIDAPEAPKTLTEALERIAAGKFTKPAKEEDEAAAKTWDYRWYRQLDWRTEPADKDGYAKATDALTEARREARDIIKVLPEKDGLEALNAFKAKTFH